MFAGIGGICLAFKQAGADIVWANDIDKYACETYRFNFGNDYLVEDDIRNINPTALPDIDILTAGFPCQPFSIMGLQKGFADPRGTMFFEILKVIDIKQPEIIFLENVKNIIKHDRGKTFSIIHASLAQRGYGIKYAILGAHTHGDIPQIRDRIFILAFKDYNMMNRFSFPGEILLTKNIDDIVDRKKKVHERFYYTDNNRNYMLLCERMNNKNAIYRIDDTGIAMKAWLICPTLKANMGTYPDRIPIIKDEYGIRRLTLKECLALQGFPVDFGFPELAQKEAYKQIGNTVCVPVVKKIVEELKTCI